MDRSTEIGGIKFVWDENKNQINIEKHKISFEEARTVFKDDCAIVKYDPEHSEYEDRFVIVGLSQTGKLLMVCHCERDVGVIRIISARKANKQEEREYND